MQYLPVQHRTGSHLKASGRRVVRFCRPAWLFLSYMFDRTHRFRLNGRVFLGAVSVCGALAVAAAAASPAERPVKPEIREFFERQVRPLLAAECFSCHGDKVKQAGLRLDTHAGLQAGGDRGPAVKPGDPDGSLLIKAVRHQAGLQMPPGRMLPARQQKILEEWVRQGAYFPASASQPAGPQSWEQAVAERRNWWSLQPLRQVSPPAVRKPGWSSHPVDMFIQSHLEREGIAPPTAADRRTLIRRISQVLTGLPPAPKDVEKFVADPSPGAYGRLVDEMLASPHFGERWARHWMDVVRYGETYGYEWNYLVRDVWRYRDYLIRAFNSDLPYDQFVREHIAGDLMPPRVNPENGLNESAAATAFYRFGEAGHDVFREIGLDVLDNQIDTLSKAFQATTISCARCHDHKLDAVSTRDYYALLGVLSSSRQVVQTLDLPQQSAPSRERLAKLRDEAAAEIAKLWLKDAAATGEQLQAAAGGAPGSADPARVEAWKKVIALKDAGLHDPLHVWRQATKPDANAERWAQLAKSYESESRERAEFNRTHFKPLGDFTKGSPDGWRLSGSGLWDGFVKPGTLSIDTSGDRLVRAVLPGGISTAALSDRLNGEMQSPDTDSGVKMISVEAMGGLGAAVRQVPDHRHLGDAGQELKPEDGLHWVRIGRSERDERVYVEVVTRLNNQRYPERATKHKATSLEDPRSWFAVTRAVTHTIGESPRPELDHLLSLVQGERPADQGALAARYQQLFTGAVERWAANRASESDIGLVNWLLVHGLISNRRPESGRLAGLLAEYARIEAQIPAPQVVAGVADHGDGYDHPVFSRGDFRSPGDPVDRGYLEVLCGDQRFAGRGSGRTELAEQLVGRKNPLTARVMVNRIWHWLFGAGLTPSVDDFGHMGEKPSHPELLDYLATRFMEDGWSVKKLIRLIVTSNTFKANSKVNAAAAEADPENRLLHHYPARRGEAELLRDSMLAVSGRLDRSLYGPSIHPYRPQEKPDRKLFAGPLDGDGRRSIYIEITLMEAPPFLYVFNQPEGKVTQGRRDVTNVPAQALTMMNDPFVIDQAAVWARRLIKEGDTSVETRLTRIYLEAMGRRPSPSERERLTRVVARMARLHSVPEAEKLSHEALWRDVAHTVFNMKEFAYIR